MLTHLLAAWRGLFFAGEPVVQAKCWHLLPAWLAVAFLLRATVALSGDFVIHTDEVAQYLEPAHWLAFGNGVLNGMYFYAARSWLAPGFIAAILRLCDAAGLGEPWFYVDAVKLVFCLLSLLIPWGVYRYSRTICCEQAARLALVFACLWPYLIAYAHKPLTEFIAADIFMAALGLASLPRSRRSVIAAAVGFLIALAALVRMQYAPAALMLWLAIIVNLPSKARLALLSGSIACVALTALVERLSWGGTAVSYLNYWLLNINLDQIRPSSSWHFYLPRMLYATGGGALLALWMLGRHPKSYALLSLCLLAVLLPHMLGSENKQFRFVFLALVLVLIPLAGWFSAHIHSAQTRFSQAGPALLAAVFCLLVLGNFLPYEQWLHKSDVSIRHISYVRDRDQLFEAYRHLAGQDDLAGVADYTNSYANTPMYYHLHKSVPYYDMQTISKVSGQYSLKLSQQVSHVISYEKPPASSGDFYLSKNFGAYKIYQRRGQQDVIGWQGHTIWNVSVLQFLFLGVAFEDYRAVPDIVLRTDNK